MVLNQSFPSLGPTALPLHPPDSYPTVDISLWAPTQHRSRRDDTEMRTHHIWRDLTISNSLLAASISSWGVPFGCFRRSIIIVVCFLMRSSNSWSRALLRRKEHVSTQSEFSFISSTGVPSISSKSKILSVTWNLVVKQIVEEGGHYNIDTLIIDIFSQLLKYIILWRNMSTHLAKFNVFHVWYFSVMSIPAIERLTKSWEFVFFFNSITVWA